MKHLIPLLRQRRFFLAIALIFKACLPVAPLLAIGGWLIWLVAAYRQRYFYPSLIAASSSLISSYFLLLTLRAIVPAAEALDLINRFNILELIGFYLFGLIAAWFYRLALARSGAGRLSWLWFAGSVVPIVGWALFPIYRLILSGIILWRLFRPALAPA